MAKMLGGSPAVSKLADSYHCCNRHNPGGNRRAHSSARQAEEREWRQDSHPEETNMKCPTCGSPELRKHPAVQLGGEVQPCRDTWHCQGDGRCNATVHVHGCYADVEGQECNERDDLAHPERRTGAGA